MSDQTLAFIDPLEEHFIDRRGRVRTGWRFGLSSDSETFERNEDQFQPYSNIFSGVTGGISTGRFNGTLFRFPLRLTSNELSDKTYNDEVQMDELLQAFCVDADVAMLFLRCLNNIEVLKRPSDQQEPTLVVRVKREQDQGVHRQEEDFSSRLQLYCSDVSGHRGPIEMIDSVTFTTETQGTSKAQRWVVSHLVAGASMSEELSELAEQQSHLPWAAVAIPMSPSEPNHGAAEAENIGRVFCFLPLPAGEESRTGLPVHVHGFFGVNSDRRGIKWPGPDQTDTPAQWNKLLVSELIPVAYVNAIKYAISVQMSQQNVTTDCIYRSWPDHKVVRGNWDILLEPFYNVFFREAVIHSDNNGWMNIAEVHFNELAVGEDMEKAILKCFSMSNIAYARVPYVCRQAINKFYNHKTSTISVSSLCRCFRDNPSILTTLSTKEKLLILEFILREDAGQDLEGLRLLPLDDGSFDDFLSSGKKVYIPTSKFSRQLVPGGDQQFIKTIPEEHSLHQLLSKMDGHYQLISLTLDAVADILKATMTTWIDDQGTWIQDRRESSLTDWLDKIWSMLYRENSSKLHLFESIRLVPLFEADGGVRRLLPLCRKSRIIQRRHQTSEGYLKLSYGLENVLQQTGVTVTNCPDCVICHPAVMRDGYIKMPTPEGVLKCLLLSGVKTLIQKFHSFSSVDRDFFVECLSQAKLFADGKTLLKRLPLFEAVPGTGGINQPLVSVDECKGYIECGRNDIPSPLKLTGLLIVGRAKSKSLLQKLEVRPLSKYEVITNVLKETDRGQLYTVQEKQDVLLWIMERWEDIKVNCKSSVDILHHMKFIPNKNNSLLSPSELLDPRDPLLDELFASQGVFPVAPFDSPHVKAALQDLGMRGQSQVTPAELITCVDLIEKSQSPEKSRKLLELLTRNQSLLQSSVADCMKRKQCIPCRQSPPDYYPSAIEWYGNSSKQLSTPKEIVREKKQAVLICGASKRFTSQEDESRFFAVYQKIGITIPSPMLSDVMSQFDHCVRYTEDRTEEDVTDIVPMVKEIYSSLTEAWRRDSNVKNVILIRAKACIWNGSGFSQPSKMCTGKLPFDLAPYMVSIPQTFAVFSDLFQELGVENNMETNADALVEILHEVRKRCDDPEAQAAFKQKQRQLVLQILHHLHAAGELSEEARRRLLVPSQEEECRLIPVEKSAYVDRDWLRQSTEGEEMHDGEDFTLIHSDISMNLAIFLHVRPLSRLLLDSEEFQGFTQAGQYEPLTMRLWNILKNNYLDTAIVNEMIQNAEDAGAQEVRFLIDMRTNKNANEKLFDPGMKSCQGPALWVYNDAVFTDKDFENILRLGGRTKEKDIEKIGKFGTGFNSVYHITDVPSFVSREYVQFFDPHTTYLRNVLPNKSQPGVRLKLNSGKQLRRFPDQFKPFNGVFGLAFCGENEPFHYQGTLFRLPLRSKEAAQKSQICKESYDGKKLISLMQRMWDSSQNILVFTKKITKVSVFYLGEHSTQPAKAEELFTIKKEVHSTRRKDDDTVMLTESFRRTMTTKGNDVMSRTAECEGKGPLDTVKVICKASKQAASLAQSPEGKEYGLSPEGAVAFPLHRQPISAFEKKMYCFLPLSITSRFPVHINGSFAVKEDRRSLHMPDPNGRLIHEKWNHILLADVICRAYVSLLSDNEFMQRVKHRYGSDVSPESLWPDIDDVPKNSESSALFDAFYKAMILGLDGHHPSLFWKDGESHRFTNVVFLGEEVQKEKSVSYVVTAVLHNHLESMKVISLTEKTWKAVEKVGLRSEVITRTYDFNRFFDEVFLPHISQVHGDMRDQLILFALNTKEGELKQKLEDVECIPVVGGTDLRKPSDLVHPNDEAAPLYFESDKVFPLGEKFNSTDTMASLIELGMITDSLHEDNFIERCETVHILHSSCPENAQKRCYAVVKYLSKSLLKRGWYEKRDLKERLKSIPFLPILYKGNRDTVLPWAETSDSCAYTSANFVYSYSKRYLASSTSKIVDKSEEWQLPRVVECFLGLADKYPSVQDVLKQFTNFRNHLEIKNEPISDAQLEMICKEVYERVEISCAENCPDSITGIVNEETGRDNITDIVNEKLQNQPFFLVDHKFVVASMISERGPDLPPRLFKVPKFLKQYPNLLQRAALKTTFDAEDYHGVLRSIYEVSRGQPLDNDVLEVAILAADRLADFVNEDENQHVDSFLPDEDKCMRPVSELCYYDVDWIKCDEIELHRCHMKISFMVAKKLNVSDIRQYMLQSYDVDFPGEDFGQDEKLTTRITRILESYPSDETILKELLQNADDAGATEIHFVFDPRSHDGNQLLGDSMKEMQGPALCVFNDRSFTDEDIRGIQNLGEGSKADHREKIGRYGVGFNAVYQLTDCPSFISKGERLCMFDPLRKYVPGATRTMPGRQIRIDESMRTSYEDVFRCYLEEELADKGNDFTVFRFPLREKASKLSKNVWPDYKIRKLLKDFETAAFESLLFLKHIIKISISEVASSGDVGCTRTICAEMSEIENEKKEKFLHKVQDYVSAPQRDGNLQTETAEVIYLMKLKGEGREEDWVICQQVGTADVAVENTMQTYKLLPVGAVAARLTDRKEKFKGKAFSFLPLPVETGLPVHVHGHFALDCESRRHLWEGSTTDEQTKWNFHITQDVIAPAYVQLLSWIQEFFVREYKWSGSILCELRDHTLKLLEKYHTFFPKVSGKGSYWTGLADTVYKIVASKALILFPSVYRKDDGQKDFFLKWKTPVQSQDELKIGYFNTLKRQMSDQKQELIMELKETLTDITFPLLESPTWIIHSLRDACKHLDHETSQYEVLEVSPSNVMAFLRGDNPLQRQLPVTLSKSRLRNEDRLRGLIDYCKKVKESKFQENLQGLPLLFTHDGILRKFSLEERVFVSSFCDLFMLQSHRFLHTKFLDILPVKADVFCELDVTAVSVLLHDCTPYLECGSNEIILLENHLSPEWFTQLWSLFRSFRTEKNKLPDIANDIRTKLGGWAILPVTQTEQTEQTEQTKIEQVAPISICPSIIIQPTTANWPIYLALEALNVYKVEKFILHEDNYTLIEHLVAHNGESTRGLDVLMYWVDRDLSRFRNLKRDHHEEILRYFCHCDSSAILTKLKSLPCFQSIGGDFVSIQGFEKVLVLPSNTMIPTEEQDKWVSTTRTVFLQYIFSLESLYKKLGLSSTTEKEVYTKYILPAFDRLSEDSRLEHLVRVKKLLEQLPSDESRRSPEERKEGAIRSLELTQLRFILGANGELMKAADFFDPENELFSLMLSRDHFPPDRVQECLGLSFLREIGLQVDVTKDLFRSFAQQVHESHSNPEEMKRKSHNLVLELRRNCKLHNDSTVFQVISMIDFLVSDEISREMKYIHPPFTKEETLMSYSRATSFKHTQLIWSTNSILPKYASISGECPSCKTVLCDRNMGVAPAPELTSVIKHLRKICNRLQEKNDKKISFPKEVVSVLQAIFTFLCSECEGQSCCQDYTCRRCCIVRQELQNVPIVFMESDDEHLLVKAEHISRTIKENLKPFLYDLPDKWGPFFRVFRILGGTVKPSIGQYAFVLESIYNRGRDAWLDPDMINIVDRATCGLYEELMEIDATLVAAAFLPGHSLYLPSCEKTLERSHHLLLNDVDHYTNRLRRSNLRLIKTFTSHKRIAREALSKLPENMKPKTVNKEVRELLSRTGNHSRKCSLIGDKPCGFERRFQVLQSREFLNAVCCIMRHNSQKVDEEIKKRFEDRLSCLKITCMQQLHSILQINGEDIEGSETEVPSFINSDQELFVQHSEAESRMETLLSVAINVNQILGNVFEDTNYISILLSQESPSTIPKVLEKFNIAVEITEEDTCHAGHQESSLPTNVEEAKRQVTIEWEEIWQLLEELKEKALYRLTKLHPDKHPEGPKELFDESFKHIESEIQRLVKGLSRTHEDLKSINQRAREDRQSDELITAASREPDIPNAHRWLRQGKEDLRAAHHDLGSHDEASPEWVAYKCHQSVEKALKADQLAIRGQYYGIHCISSLAKDVKDHSIKSSEFLQNVKKLTSLVNDQQARYPDMWPIPIIPHEAFGDKAKPEEMIELAHSILEEVQTSLHPS